MSSTGISTRIEGKPAAFTALAAWIDEVDDTIAETESILASAGSDASWSGETGDAFRSSASTLQTAARTCVDTFPGAAKALREHASVLAAAQRDAAAVRAAAVEAGLLVEAAVIRPPSEILQSPPPLPPGASPLDAKTYADAVAAVTVNAALWTAYRAAELSMAAVLGALRASEENLRRMLKALDAAKLPLLSAANDAGAGAASGAAESRAARSAKLAKDADDLTRKAFSALKNTSGKPPVLTDEFFRNLKTAGELTRASADDAARAAKLAKLGKAGGVVGAALTGWSIQQDLAQGESTAQAITSNGVGLGASILAGIGTGALVGSAVPGAGTVVGAVAGAVVSAAGGAAVGVLAGGVADGFFEKGDIGEAIENGWRDLVDTGEAIATAGSSAIGAAGDGLRGGWKALFG